MKQSVLVIDHEPLNLQFCLECVEEGWEVFWFPGENHGGIGPKDVGKGFKDITIINNWVPYIKQVDLTVLMDNSQYIERLDAFKKKGYRIYSPSVASADLEIDRQKFTKFMNKHGIDTPPQFTFNTLDEVIAFLIKDKRRFVFKTAGDEEDKSMSYCSKDATDMINHIQWLKDNGKIPKGQIILQLFIKGYEFCVGIFVGANGFIGKYAEGFEHKSLFPNEKGPATGELGTVSKYVDSSTLGDTVLKPLEASLVKMGHLGFFDVNCIVDEQGKAYPLEATSRFGYPIWMLQQKQHTSKGCQWMLDACDGKNTLGVKTDIGIIVVVVVKPFPFETDVKAYKESLGLPIYGITAGNRKHLSPQFVKMGEYFLIDDTNNVKRVKGWVTAGTYFMCVTALGESIEQCRTRVYKTIDQIFVSGYFYRDDIGEKVIDWLPDLHKMKYALEFK